MNKYRHENKYILNYQELAALKVRMTSFFHLDSHCKNGEYMIRSLYFDDVWNSAYKEKEMGIFFRKKYRIRIYNFSDETIRLERKIKKNSYIFKESAPLTRDEVYMILNGDYDFLLRKKHRLLNEFYFECISNYLRARVIVDYDREPYIYDAGTVRVTFDKNVRAAIGSFDIFDDSLSSIYVMPSDRLIMEVKYTEFLPKIIKEMVHPYIGENVAFSKYVMCCDKTAYLRP